MVVVFVVIVALLLVAGAAVAVMGSRRGHPAAEPHARALEALGRMQQSRSTAPSRPAYRNGPARPPAHRTVPRRRARRRSAGALPLAVAALVLLNLVAGAVLALSLTNPDQKSSNAAGLEPPGTHSPTSVAPTSAPAHHATSSTTAAKTSSSLPAPPAHQAPAIGGPVIAAISPASGVAGQVVTLTGTGLFSADGVITVTFGSAQAPVSCPSDNTCHATVPSPASSSSGTVSVTVKTQSGTSNGVAFSYA